MKITPELNHVLQGQADRFRQKFGREIGPDDPVFFDPNATEPQPLDSTKMVDQVVETMATVGIPPEIIYAYKKTDGLLVTDGNYDRLRPEDRDAWDAAIEEYRQLTQSRQ